MTTDVKTNALGHYEPLTETIEKYKAEIKQLRGSIEGDFKEDDDVVLYRFLRGYRFVFEQSSAALNAMLKWRAENKLEDIRKKAPSMSQKDFPHYEKLIKCYPHNIHHGYDKKGQPVSIERLGRTDPALLTRLVTLEQLVEYHLYHLEHKAVKISELSTKKGMIMRNCKIIDMEGLGSKHLSSVTGLKYLRHLLTMSQANYPEMAGTIYIVNVPFILNALWKIIKPWLQPATLEKIHFLGSDYKTVLRGVVDDDNLPAFLGGKCTCADKGGCIVEVDPEEGFTKTTVGRRDTFSTDLQVEKELAAVLAAEQVAESTLTDTSDTSSSASASSSTSTSSKPLLAEGEEVVISWEFRTSKDIDFSIVRKEEKKETVVVEKSRVDSHVQHTVGEYITTSLSPLTFVWDNTYSTFTSKTLLYRFEVIKRVKGGKQEVTIEEGTGETSAASASSTSTSSSASTTTTTATEATSS